MEEEFSKFLYAYYFITITIVISNRVIGFRESSKSSPPPPFGRRREVPLFKQTIAKHIARSLSVPAPDCTYRRVRRLGESSPKMRRRRRFLPQSPTGSL